MTITLPDELKDRLAQRAAIKGFPSVEEYVLGLIEEEEAAGPPELSPRNRAELEAMLEEGMNSGPPVRADAAFWEERRRVLEERIAERQKATT